MDPIYLSLTDEELVTRLANDGHIENDLLIALLVERLGRALDVIKDLEDTHGVS